MTVTMFTRPATCATCPFRGGFYLERARRAEIHQAMAVNDQTFHCRSEVDYSAEDEGLEGDTTTAKQCAEAVTLAIREGWATQLMRIGERVGETQPNDPAVPFQDFQEWIQEPEFSGPPREEEGTGEPCSVVNPECEHPAGWATGGGAAANSEANAPHWCPECGDPVCDACLGEDGTHCDYCYEEMSA